MRRKLIGRQLRVRRKQAGLPASDPEVIAIVGSTRTQNRLESGEATQLTFPIIGALCDLYGVPAEERFELQRLWRLGPATTWTQPRDRSVFGFDAYRELELHASEVYRYESTYIPGHLQTERHMRGLFSRNRDLEPEEVERNVNERLRWQRPFWHGADRRAYFLLSEAVLRFGCDQEQLDHLKAADALEHATVNYLPFDGGPPSGLHVPFALLSFEEESDPDIVYVEAQDSHLYFEESSSVRHYRTCLDKADDQARSIKEFRP
ncbi:helix-turn-helix domain-containing protein [Glycomyces xiaoerkulensis]|uniref:helix-turn-helix domain-containing protein n=1 Tax=Glycomyces xiaoerkulensis TaxID=2038139 RepID=UPI000C25BF43|nr:helix-turn-helix transcriptional regulator [Glycomyces xiaoerkulensis]